MPRGDGVGPTLGKQPDGPFTRHGAEVAHIEREHCSTATFTTGDDGGVGETQREIGVAVDELSYPRQIAISAVSGERSHLKIMKEQIECRWDALLDQIGDLSHDRQRDQVRPACLLQGATRALVI